MAFIPALDCVKVALHFLWNSQQCINTLWYQNIAPGSYTAQQRIDLTTELLAWWNNHAKLNLSADISLQAIEVINQESASAPSTLTVYSPVIPGVGSASTPLNVALCISFRTALRGRNFRGRNYVGGVPIAAMVDRGTFAVSNVGSIATACFKLSDPAIITKGFQKIASHFVNKLPRPTALLTSVNAVVGETLADSSRRRLIGRGN